MRYHLFLSAPPPDITLVLQVYPCSTISCPVSGRRSETIFTTLCSDMLCDCYKKAHKTIQNTPFQQHTIFSNTEMLWGGFLFLFLYNFFYNIFFSIEKFVILCVKYFIPYYCIYRNMVPQSLNSLLRLVVAKWTFVVWFHTKKKWFLA